MRRFFEIVMTFSSILILSACELELSVTDDQKIPITIYDDPEQNLALARIISIYNRAYIAREIPSLTDETSTGITIGWFRSAINDTVSYQVTYDLNNEAVDQRIDRLKAEFNAYIPKLIEAHVAQEEQFEALIPMGRDWITSLFENEPKTVYPTLNQYIRDDIALNDFVEWLENLQEASGGVSSAELYFSQYLEEFRGQPPHHDLYFRLKPNKETKQKPMLKVAFSQSNEEWYVGGFQYYENFSWD